MAQAAIIKTMGCGVPSATNPTSEPLNAPKAKPQAPISAVAVALLWGKISVIPAMELALTNPWHPKNSIISRINMGSVGAPLTSV